MHDVDDVLAYAHGRGMVAIPPPRSPRPTRARDAEVFLERQLEARSAHPAELGDHPRRHRDRGPESSGCTPSIDSRRWGTPWRAPSGTAASAPRPPRAVIDIAFRTWGELNRIRAMADVDNTASQRVMVQAGDDEERGCSGRTGSNEAPRSTRRGSGFSAPSGRAAHGRRPPPRPDRRCHGPDRRSSRPGGLHLRRRRAPDSAHDGPGAARSPGEGSALPRERFITWPTRKPSSRSSPSRRRPTSSGKPGHDLVDPRLRARPRHGPARVRGPLPPRRGAPSPSATCSRTRFATPSEIAPSATSPMSSASARAPRPEARRRKRHAR